MQTVPLQGSPEAGHRGAGGDSGGETVPFSDSINPQALYPHDAFQDVLAELAQAKISDREGATLITGAAGSGKTSLIARLLTEAERAEGSLRLAGSEDLTFSRFLKFCAEGFGLPAEFANAKDHLKALSAFLVERARSGRSSTIVIDPADNLNARFLGELSEFATWSKAGRRLSNVILVGQGTSGGQAGPKFAGVKIALHCHLRPLAPAEVGLYLAHHLRLAGCSRPDLLATDVVGAIVETSGGLPGRINKLARALLWAAPADSGVAITADLVAETAHILEAGERDDRGAAAVSETVAETAAAPWDEAPLDAESTLQAPGPAAPATAVEAAEAEDNPAWPLDLSLSEKLAEADESEPEAPALVQSRPRRGRRLWVGLGAGGIAAGLLLAAAFHQTWPEKVVSLLDDYEISLPSIDQLAERFKLTAPPSEPQKLAESGAQNPADNGAAAGVPAVPSGAAAKPPVSLSADVGREDEPLRLQVSGDLEGGQDMAQVEVTVAGLPAGARLSAGSRDKTGLWHLRAENLQDLTLLLPTDYSGNFGLAVSVASQQSGGAVTYATQAVPIHIKAVPDVPLLRVSKAVGEEGEPLPLDIDAELVDKDGSEILTLFVADLPEGARLSAGKRQGDGSWLLEPQQVKGLRLIPPSDLSGSFTLTVMALASERHGGSVPAKLPLSVKIEPGAAPLLTLAPVAGREGEPVPLALAASLADPERSESLYLLFKGMPGGAQLSAGRDIGEGVWRVEEDALAGLKLVPPAGWSGGFDLEVTAVALNRDGSESKVTDSAPVRFDAPSDAAEAPAKAGPVQAEEALQAKAKLPPSADAAQDIAGEDFDLSQGDRLLAAKDLTAARRYFQQAADRGNPKAMTALGATYDPHELTRFGIAEAESDSSLARHWYLRGVAGGDLEAMKRLQALSAQP